MNKNKIEAKITEEYINKYISKKDWIYKIPDEGRANKPFDIVGIIDGKPTAIELKVIKAKEVTYERVYKKLELHQVLSLYHFKHAGGKSYIIGYGIHDKKYHKYEFYILQQKKGPKKN